MSVVMERNQAVCLVHPLRSADGNGGFEHSRMVRKETGAFRMLARQSHELMERYRRGEEIPETCPLEKALSMATSPKAELHDFLRHSEATPAAKALLKRTFQEFVLEYGWWYEPSRSDLKFATGTPQECHKNASDLALADDSLIYCEGYASSSPSTGMATRWSFTLGTIKCCFPTQA